MTYQTEHAGSVYKWVEKADRACLIKDETKLLWWGEVGDPRNLIDPRIVPLEVLLTFSLLRRLEKKDRLSS